MNNGVIMMDGVILEGGVIVKGGVLYWRVGLVITLQMYNKITSL